jgi:hypothetical protein
MDEPGAPPRGSWRERLTPERAAFVTFLAIEIAGGIVYVVNGRKVWFFGVFGDEWDFLAGRRLTVHDLLLRHGDHLVALPALVFRLLYSTVGLRSYFPYQLISIGLHLVAAWLLRVVMRRAGVQPWIATAAAGLFVLFGAGSQDILIAFQMTFTGALALGLAQLVLADHEGPIDRRDAFGVLAGLGALLCSDVAIVMIAAVGIALLLRRRWRATALHIAPLAAVYLAWAVAYGRGARTDLHVSRVASSVRTSVAAVFGALGQVPLGGWVLAAMLVIGLAIALRAGRAPIAEAASVLALGCAGFAFVTMLAVTRFGLGAQFAASSRYLHVVAALLLPALAVAADAIARYRRPLVLVVLALLLMGVPGNITKIARNVGPAARYREQRRVIGALPRLKLASATPRALQPTPSFAAEVTIGWLLDGAAAGRIPAARHASARQHATDVLRLSLEQVDGKGAAACHPLLRPTTRTLARGESFGITGAIDVQALPAGRGVVSQPLPFGTSLLATSPTHTLRALRPLKLRLAARTRLAALC